MLNSKVVSAMFDTGIGTAWNLRSIGIPVKAMTKLLKLIEDGAYYFSHKLKSDPGIVIDRQAALDMLKRDGNIDAIIRNYPTQGK